MRTRPFKQRTRTGSWSTFERRFAPLPAPHHDILWDLHQLPKDTAVSYTHLTLLTILRV